MSLTSFRSLLVSFVSLGRCTSAGAVLAMGALSAGCLEASAMVPGSDAGTHANADTGTTVTREASTGSDAHTSMDATVDGTKPATEASTPTVDAAMLPSCTSPTTADTTCFKCLDTSCSATAGAAITACASFYTCYEKCACSDGACVSACQTAAASDMTCVSAAEALQSCQKTSCAMPCATPDAGSTQPKDAAPVGDAGATCLNPSATYKSCAACDESKCGSDVTAAQTACAGTTFPTCTAKCQCSDTSCVEACATASTVPTACVTALTNTYNCQSSSCTAACTASANDAGTQKDGGNTSGIPDCKSPTSAQQTAYASCLACDNQNCASYVSAAVSGCSTYYACIASTDCTTALTSCTPSTACDTAASPLVDCQAFFCSSACAGLY